MDETQPVLRIARQRGELEGVLQSELRAKEAEVVEKLNGFRLTNNVGRDALLRVPDFRAARQRRPTGFMGEMAGHRSTVKVMSQEGMLAHAIPPELPRKPPVQNPVGR